MAYATASQYLEAFGADEAFQLLQDEERLLTPEKLLEAIDGTLPDTDTSPEAAAARAALTRLDDELVNASRLMDGYFRRVVVLPLTQDQITQSPVRKCCLELTRCALMDDPGNLTDLAEKRCEQWIAWLRDVAAQRTTLVDGETGGRVVMGKLPSEYNWKVYPS